MLRASRTLAFISAVLSAVVCLGEQPQQTDANRELQQRRLDAMRQRVEALKAVGADEEALAFSEQPVLRYNDTPRGVRDASVWILGHEGRPRAVLVLEVYGGEIVQYELTATADPPKQVQTPGWQWRPRQSDFTWKPIPAATPPRDAASLRQRQIKQLAQDFAASEQYAGQTYQLRLMPQPIYEYEDREQGILSGAVFVWAHGTNVEILMFLEAHREDGSPPQWVAGFSRLAAASLDVTYRQQNFWSSPSSSSATATDAYYYRGESLTPMEQTVFATE